MGTTPSLCGPFRGQPGFELPPSPVLLHVYNCGKSLQLTAANSVLRVLGTGAFHCGVEVHDREWSFQSSGIFCCWPRLCSKHNYFESVVLGETMLTETAVLAIIRSFKESDWTDDSYDLLEHNCCHFSDTLCRSLGVAGVPAWVLSLAVAGVALRHTCQCVGLGCCSACPRSTATQSAAPETICADVVQPIPTLTSVDWGNAEDTYAPAVVSAPPARNHHDLVTGVMRPMTLST
mmetsp:Transcript_55843/g.125978  ORF Transcript_55843/g.125978 Transcript_55843/m.125978 type:complete len:234 (+) Transcript_55843:64-765(+)